MDKYIFQDHQNVSKWFTDGFGDVAYTMQESQLEIGKMCTVNHLQLDNSPFPGLMLPKVTK
jgi:hypothetical protein